MNSLEKLYKSIEESKLYKDYKKISTILEEDDSIQKLINEIKDLEKEATLLEYKGDIKYKEIDKIIEKKMLELKNNQIYIEYMNKMEEFNNVLKESSNIKIEEECDYIEDLINEPFFIIKSKNIWVYNNIEIDINDYNPVSTISGSGE